MSFRMDWSSLICCLLFSVPQSVMGFNIESIPWRHFIQNQDTAFGYKVIQRDESSLIVSDPLLQRGNKRGEVYSCGINPRENCSPLQILKEPPEAVNMSLGLSMTKDPRSSKIMVCGPTIPKDCKPITTYNGMCFTIEGSTVHTVPRVLRDCPPPAPTDIAFLLDGSGSVNYYDFNKMKEFVIKLIQGLSSQDIRFAVAQYSYVCTIHVDFTSSLNTDHIMDISQIVGGTYTGKAINKLVNELFVRNARPDANRVLIVITDGQSSHGDDNLWAAAENVKRNKIIRYAIGVGRAFNDPSAENELNIIASDPDSDYKFKVDNFDVLDKIRKKMETNIIAIEGTQTSGDSTKMEFPQDGFSAAFVPNGNVILSAVGAYQWKGGYQEYSSGRPYQFQQGSEHDSYLGYSMTVATTRSFTYVVLGAPRHKHKGAVVISTLQTKASFQLVPEEPQIGAYFGAEVCAVDLNSDSYTDLLLVSAPLHTEGGWDGNVFVFSMSYRPELKMTLNGVAGQMGRFGSSVASPADLNGDKIRDVVVGAPLEDNGKGSIYIFNGRAEDITPTYSQRISGSSVQTGLRFFGLSLSESALDHSRDGLPDIAVGSKGRVILLRSRPIVSLATKVTYSPSKIPIKPTDCVNPLENILRLCFTMSGLNTQIRDLAANINYTLKLDAKRQTSRAYFTSKNRLLTDKMTVQLQEVCREHKFFIETCTEDALNPLSNELTFAFEGLPLSRLDNLKPVLHPDIRHTSDHNLDFQMECGTDNICIDNLKVDFNCSGHIEVGKMQDMSVTVFVENRGENSYGSHVRVTYLFGFSFRKVTSKQGRVECMSVDSDQKGTLGITTCYINKPIFRANSSAVFEITYSTNKESNFDRTVSFTATAHSDNDEHTPDSKLSKSKNIGVKYAIYVTLIRYWNSRIRFNVTAIKNNLEKPVNEIFKVENDLRAVNLTVLIRVPIKLGKKDIWANNNLQIQDCSMDRDEPPTIPDFVEALKKQPSVDCSVAVCRLFRCSANLKRLDLKFYNISANVSSGWIEQTGLRSAVFELVSTATLEYDKNKYYYFDSLNTATIGKRWHCI
ncbi:hypothetical protein MHYP_G00160000 [Metynnis hypsauchen]